MASGDASWAVTLPNQFEPYGNILQRGIAQQGQQNQMLYSEMLRKRQQDQQNERYNINLIQEEAKAKDLATGNTTFDNWLGGEYDKSLKEIMSMPLSSMPPAELFVKVKEKFAPLTQTAMRLKNTMNTIDENTRLVGSEMTDIDTGTVAARAKEMAINELMPIDTNTGVRNYMPQNFKPDRNYVGEVMSSPNSWELVKDGSKFTDYVKNYKTSPISLHKQFADKSMQGYTGRATPFKKLNVTPDENSRIKSTENPQLQVDVQDDFITENGQSKPIKILADAPYQLIEANEQASRGLNHLWEKHKKENNLSFSSPIENEKRKREFAVGVIDAADVSEIAGQTPTHLPRTSIRVSSGGGGKGSDETNINDIYKRIQEATSKRAKEYASGGANTNAVVLSEMPFDEQGVIIDFANKGRSGNDSYTPADIKVIEDSDGKIGVYELSTGNRVGYLPRTGTNLKVQPGVKEKREVVAEGEGGSTISVNDIPAGTKLDKKGSKYYYKGKEVKM